MPADPSPDAITLPFRDLETLKRWHSKLIEATLDELSPQEALQFAEWLKDDATGRLYEMDPDYLDFPP